MSLNKSILIRVVGILLSIVNEYDLHPTHVSVPVDVIKDRAVEGRNTNISVSQVERLVNGALIELIQAKFLVADAFDGKVFVKLTDLGYRRYLRKASGVDMKPQIKEVRVIYKSSPKVYKYTKNFHKVDKKNVAKYHVVYA